MHEADLFEALERNQRPNTCILDGLFEIYVHGVCAKAERLTDITLRRRDALTLNRNI